MSAFARPLFLAALILPSALFAQATQGEIEARLLHKPLYLRGLWRGDKLHFDASGRVLGNPAKLTFTLSGIEIKKVTLDPDKLILEGKRVGLEFQNDKPKRVALYREDKIQLEIDTVPDFNGALTTIFAPTLADLVPSLPSYWKDYARRHLVATPDTSPLPAANKPTGKVTIPKVLKSVEPQFSDAARALEYSCSTLVGLTVSEVGRVTEVSVIRPCGLGLDEQALAAAVQYQFAPATQDGKPIATVVHFDIRFGPP